MEKSIKREFEAKHLYYNSVYASKTAFSELPLEDLSFQRRLESRKGHSFGRLDSSLRWDDKHSYVELTLLKEFMNADFNVEQLRI